MTDEQTKLYEQWFSERPPHVQEMIKKYPPGKYVVRQGAPYAISCPGTIVEIVSYGEDGEVGVTIKPENKLPEAIEHEKRLALQHGTPPEKLKKLQESGVMVRIDPKYLTLILKL